MDIQIATLSDILDFRPRELSKEEWSRLESLKGVMELRRPLEKARLSGDWAGLRNKMLAEAGGLLDIRILDVMRWAWKKGFELEAYRDTERYPPDKTFNVSLVEHKITSTHEPHVDIRMNDKKVGSIHFAVNIEIAIKAVILEIRNARIKKIHAGECKAKGSFLCEGLLLAERESESLDLPGTIDLGEGLKI
ncbi:MAG: hypothetical protein DME71_12300 [Verrucomicrobia bacterium]|nr:MAG: hypothetical protein DME71_12300 [Verrucomicrobiota bacterium]